MASHHMKRLQREEIKESTEFYNRINGIREVQDRKSESERQEVEKRFEGMSEVMARSQRKEIEKLEQHQMQQFRNRAKSLKTEQVTENNVSPYLYIPLYICICIHT